MTVWRKNIWRSQSAWRIVHDQENLKSYAKKPSKGIWRRPMPENDKTGTRKLCQLYHLHCAQDYQRYGGKQSETFQETSCGVMQWLRSIWWVVPFWWMTWWYTEIKSSFFSIRKFSPLNLSSRNKTIGS